MKHESSKKYKQVFPLTQYVVVIWQMLFLIYTSPPSLCSWIIVKWSLVLSFYQGIITLLLYCNQTSSCQLQNKIRKSHLASRRRHCVAHASISNNICSEMYILAKKNVKCFPFCMFVPVWKSLFNYLPQLPINGGEGGGAGTGKSYFKK